MSDGSSDVCCTGLAGNGDAPRPRPKALPARLNVVDVVGAGGVGGLEQLVEGAERATELLLPAIPFRPLVAAGLGPGGDLVGRRHVELHPGLGHLRHRSEEHTSELQSLMRISYAVFCLKKKTTT